MRLERLSKGDMVDRYLILLPPPSDAKQRREFLNGFETALAALADFVDCDFSFPEAVSLCLVYLKAERGKPHTVYSGDCRPL